MMQPTIEDLVARHLDDLYAGALCLCGGDSEAAGALVPEAMRTAARDYARERPEPPDLFLETRLVQTLLARGSELGVQVVPDPGLGGIPVSGTPNATEVFEWMAVLPLRVRAAVWMVMVRRRRYADAAKALHATRGEVAVWIRQSHSLLQQPDPGLEQGGHEA